MGDFEHDLLSHFSLRGSELLESLREGKPLDDVLLGRIHTCIETFLGEWTSAQSLKAARAETEDEAQQTDA